MAKPRVFVSSTYYDLRSVRDDVDRFIRSMGFEPVRHERGHIAYGQDQAPEEYAYREIEYCDILVCVIGGRLGTVSAEGGYSITQKELKSAIERGKQVYIFVEEPVHYEHRHYLANKGVEGVKFSAVDNVKIHQFLEEIYALPQGNPIFSFSVSSDITTMLGEQWAGLFQRLLTEHSAKSQTALVDELQRSLQTVGQLVQFLTEEKSKGGKAVEEILFANHPVFDAMRNVLQNRYRVYFTSYDEMKEWLFSAKGYKEDDVPVDDDYFEFVRSLRRTDGQTEVYRLGVGKKLFSGDGKLLPMGPAAWEDDLLRHQKYMAKPKPKSRAPTGFDDMDDDIPF